MSGTWANVRRRYADGKFPVGASVILQDGGRLEGVAVIVTAHTAAGYMVSVPGERGERTAYRVKAPLT